MLCNKVTTGVTVLVLLLAACNDWPSRDEAGVCYVDEHMEDRENCGCDGECAGKLVCVQGVCDSECGNHSCEVDPELLSPESCESCPHDCGNCPPVCGDGEQEGFEQCDDGNLVDDDGCSSACLDEAKLCGNGAVDTAKEECDGVNGCTDKCKWEKPFCGNDIEEPLAGEDCWTCPEDMGECVCGDGACVGEDEGCLSCPEDCACPSGIECVEDQCCYPDCAGRNCGDDGCGGDCGECAEFFACHANWCFVASEDCPDMLECMDLCCAEKGCDAGIAVCLSGCLSTATATAKETYLPLFECIKKQCGEKIEKHCYDENVGLCVEGGNPSCNNQ